MEKKLKQIFKFFDINDEEIDGFLVNDIGVNSLDEFKINSEATEKLADFFKINKDFIYGNSNNLLIEKDGFYKRSEKFCEEILIRDISTLYIISEKTPNKEIDEEDDGNYFYLVAEYSKKLFNNKEIKVFEVFNTNGCRWGYWRCRWEIKKFLLCLKKIYLINKVMGIIDENIVNDYSKFLKGEIKFEKILGNLNIWYPEDYIEFKYENVNAKEDDELEKIFKYKIEAVEYKFKDYLIDIYGYSSDDIKLNYKINNSIYDLVILNNNKPFIVFELKIDLKNLNTLKEISVIKLYNEEADYYVLVTPYGNEWYMECYDKSGKLIDNIPYFKTLDEELIIKKLYDLFYKGGREDFLSVKKSLFYILSYYENLKNRFQNKLINIKNNDFEINKIEIFIAIRLLSFIEVKNNKKLIKTLFDLVVDKKVRFLKFKEETIEFLNNFVNKSYEIEGFQPDLIKFFSRCYIKDNNEDANLVKNLLDKCNQKGQSESIFYVNVSNIYLDKMDFTKYKEGILLVGYSFFNQIKKHPKFKEIVKKIKIIINFYEPIFENSDVDFSLIFLGEENENIYIANLDFEKLFKYEEEILKFLKENKKIEENDTIFSITNEDFENYKIEFIKILNILKKIKNKPHKKLKELAEIIEGNFCKKEGNIKKLITLKNIKYNKIFSLELISENCYKKGELTKNNDFVISKKGNYKFAEITKEYENCVIDNNLFIIRPKDNESYEIIKKLLFSKLGSTIFNNIRSGFTTSGKVFLQDLKNILIPINLDDIDIKLDYKTKEEYFTPCKDEKISFIGIGDTVLNFSVITGFLTKKDIEKIEIKEAKFQRNLYQDHLNKLIDFLQNKEAKYKFLPFLVLGVENFDEIEREDFYLENTVIYKMCMTKEDFENNVKIIDGNHRWNAIKKSIETLNDNFQIGIVFVILGKNAFSPIFYTLNSKAKPLISSDFVNLMEQKEEVLNELRKLGIDSPNIYFDIRKFFKEKNIFNYNQITIKNLTSNNFQKFNIDEKILELVSFIEKYKLTNKIDYFKLGFEVINNKIYNSLIIDEFEKILISFNITKSILRFYNDWQDFEKFFEKEFLDFYQYLKETQLLKKINELDLYPIFETYKKTYIPKSRKIYLSMPYHIHEDLIYFVVKDVVREIEKKIKESIELIRTDKRKLGIHKQIENKIYEEIEESDLLIADITGNNPNVFAEVGYKIALDKAKGLKEPQIIFIKNTRGYYERSYYKEKRGHKVDEFMVNEHIRKNKVTTVAFNFNHIDQIEFSDVEYLKRELENMLLKYYNYYQIKKV